MKERFLFLNEIENDTKRTYQPKTELVIDGIGYDIHILINNFIGALEQKKDIAVYFAHRIFQIDKLPTKYYNSSKPGFLIFYLINFVCNTLYKGEQLKKLKQLISIGIKWFKELKNLKESFLCWQNIILIMIKEKDITDYIPHEKSKELYKLYKNNIMGKIMKFDDWVYDSHTKIGRREGKDLRYFAAESSKVFNEDETINKDYKEACNFGYFLEDKKENINI